MTKLVGGARYSAYAPTSDPSGSIEQQLEMCWTTQP
jgi:hypothetical protein